MPLPYTGLGIGLCLWGTLLGGWASPASSLGLAPTLAQTGTQPLAQAEDLDTLPETKPLTLVVEGEPREVVLHLYQRRDRPLVTYYPPAMVTHDFCDSDGCGLSFVDEALGITYLGELDGHGFAAIVLFAPDAGDGFVPLANAVLSEVRMPATEGERPSP
ncbi:MAG TPA: hypothetical protein IGR64_02380 [Leptolyngbyaceae cyanobacterium M65_K2018_010]|nr:hypothetical protein [Leptolyngbyaceae cyanobacterium M65_K2018_010]